MSTKEKHMNRRSFLKATTIGSATLALSVGVADITRAAQTEKGSAPKRMPTRVLGKTGVSIPILSMGSTDWVTNQSLLRIALQMGVTFWDTASDYENGKSEIGIGQYLAKYPEDRKKIFLVSKPTRAFEPKEMSTLLTQSLERMHTDYVDLFGLQGVQDVNVLTPEIKAWAEQKKKEGKIKFFGFNVHANGPAMFIAAAKLGWIDVINSTYNYQMINDDMNKGLDALVKANIGFIAMKTMGMRFGGAPPNMPPGQEGEPPRGEQGGPPGAGGQAPGQGGRPQGPPPGMQPPAASQEPEDLSAMKHFMDKGYTLEQAKLKLLWEDARVTSCLSKMTNLTILKDNVAAATDNQKLSSLDINVLKRLTEDTRSFYCQGCMRCESVMSSESRIYDVLRYMMYYNSYGERDQAKELFRQMPEAIRNAMSSKDYTRAEGICPNRVKIGSAMREAVMLLG